MDKFEEVVLYEIRENRKEIARLREEYNSFKVKVFGFVTLLTALIQAGAEFIRK